MIETVGLCKSYRSLTAVDSLTFKVNKGEIVGFLGPNGAGKTTTMKILTGFMPATSGIAKVADFNVLDEPMQVRRRIGYLPEQPPVYLDLTVNEYLRFVGKLKGLRSKKLQSEIERVVEITKLGDERHTLIAPLSKGFRQRVGLAQALLGDPEVLILDEPTVGLDPRQIGEVRSLVKSLAGNHTVLLSTHILQEVAATCDRVIIINHGTIVADDKLDDLVAKHRHDSEAASLEQVFLQLTEA
ncbi:MAG: ATP-binding cassette domain-containing protein [Deltaproteobacteria bacterium]|nr:ATP-binding cassette domain-containing protein [Deltaproteobacteria bacterium]